MNIDSNNGLLDEARYVPSPNCDDRPENEAISLIVVHGISLPPGEFEGNWIDDFFTNRLDPKAHDYFVEIADLQVSSHLLIRRNGEIVQYVPFHQRAWHAGESRFDGRERCNDFSIGIELEGTDDLPYEYVQYEKLAEVIRVLKQAYPDISNERIAGHSDIAPERKTDPGEAFDWQYLYGLLA